MRTVTVGGRDLKNVCLFSIETHQGLFSSNLTKKKSHAYVFKHNLRVNNSSASVSHKLIEIITVNPA